MASLVESHVQLGARVEPTQTDVDISSHEKSDTNNEAEAEGEQSGSGNAISLARLVTLLTVLWVGVFFPVLDETMIATLLIPISTSFSSFGNLSWIATAYVIGMSAATPISGHLTDIFGRKYGYLFVAGVFLVGTLLCGLSSNLPVLLLGRALAGAGGGSMQSISSFIEADLVSLRNRGITEGVGGCVYGVAIAVGGLFGGGINDALSWRWAFLIQVPIMAVVMLLVWFFIRAPTQQTTGLTTNIHRIDFAGGFALVAGIVLLQLGLQSGEESSSWSRAIVVSSLVISVVCLTFFVVWDVKFATEPVLPLRQLKGRNLLLSCIFYFCALMSYMTVEFYVPIYLQVLGFSTTEVGLRFLPQAICAAVATFLVGIWVKLRGTWYWINVVIQGCNMLGCGLMLLLKQDSPTWYPFVFLALAGIGFGGGWVTVLMAVLSTVDNKDQATVQSTGYLLRTLGMTFGLVVSSLVFQRILSDQLREIFAGDLLHELLTKLDSLQTLKDGTKLMAQESYINSLHAVFWLTFGESVLAALATFSMKQYPIPDSLRNGT